MKSCIQCNFLLEDNQKFCAECGVKQPEIKYNLTNDNNSPIIGDKNVMSGVNFGRTEEYKITGNTTINKIEDDTKRIINCAVSGKRILFIDSILCSSCTKEVSQDFFNTSNGRCLNCDKIAQQQYSVQLDKFLSDGMIDGKERLHLDSLALSLSIDTQTKQRLENEAKQLKENLKLNYIDKNNTELSGFYKIQFKKAVIAVFENSDFKSALEILFKVHNENIYNEEVAALYYVVKAIQNPEEYIFNYEKENSSNLDIYWKDYWAFLPYLVLKKEEVAFKIINSNKARFSDNYNDILLCEVISFITLYINSEEEDYITEARFAYEAFGRNVKQPLIILKDLIGKLLNAEVTDWNKIQTSLNLNEQFYFKYVLGFKNENPQTRSKIYSNSEEIDVNINDEIKLESSLENHQVNSSYKPTYDSNDNLWVDKLSGLLLKNNKLIYVSSITGEEVPTLITNNTIWTAKNISYKSYKKTGLNINKNWLFPGKEDWNLLSRFIAKKNNENHYLINENPINSDGIEWGVNDKLTCINSNNSVVEGNDYYIVGYDANGVYLWDEKTQDYLKQPQSSQHLLSISKKRFKLKEKWEPGIKLPSIYNEYFDVSFIHPKFKVANKFGINYSESTFAIKNNNSYSLAGLVVSKHSNPHVIDLNDDIMVGVRCFLPITKSIKESLMLAEFNFPEFINLEEIKPINKFENELESSIFNILPDTKVVCSNKFTFENELDLLLNLNKEYIVKEVNSNKQQLTLVEFPQQNKADKKKWFDFRNFN